MQKIKGFLLFGIILLVIFSNLAVITASEITAEEIMQKRDDNEYIRSARAEAKMIISKGGRELEKDMILLSKDNSALMEFTNPRDRGTKFLKREDNLWMFFPDAEDIVKISGHMLEQGLMGSDFSYQDMMESDKLTELYQFEILREETYQQRPCYVIESIAVPDKEVSYYRRLMWIDKERFVGLKEELYAQSGRLLKVGIVEKVEEIDGRWLSTESIMENKLRKDTFTQFIVEEIELNPDLDDDIFSLKSLR